MSYEMSYQTLKTASMAKESEDLRQEARKRNLLILILSHLSEHGYLDTSATLEKEANISLNRWQVCDNVDLNNILQEYESYYFIKFQKQPKIAKKVNSVPDASKIRPGRIKRSLTTLGSNNDQQHSSTSLPQIAGGGNSSAPAASSGGRRRPSSGSGEGKKKNFLKPPPHPDSGGGRQTSSVMASNMSGNGETADGNMKASDLGLTVSSVRSTGGGRDEAATGAKRERVKKEIIDVRSMLTDAIRGASNDINQQQPSPYQLSSSASSNQNDKLVKPLGGFVGYNQEMRELATVISRDIFLNNPDVKWNDIVGLDHAKTLVKEAVVYPIKYPQLFTGILSPWKGILLYGPPGTGKTMLAKAVATECNTTFFNISASTIVSKWRGDSEKLVRVLFELARFHAPSTIFLDELESVMSQRGSGSGPGGEHEGSRRMKTELLVQMDGLAKSDDLVFVLAASNLPWELDQAMLRRLEKRILVDLPIVEARKSMFRRFLPPCNDEGGLVINTRLDYDVLAQETSGYSGSDLRLVSKEAAMRVVRKIFHTLEHHDDHEDLPDFSLDVITTDDVISVLRHTKPSADKNAHKYHDWRSKYESL